MQKNPNTISIFELWKKAHQYSRKNFWFKSKFKKALPQVGGIPDNNNCLNTFLNQPEYIKWFGESKASIKLVMGKVDNKIIAIKVTLFFYIDFQIDWVVCAYDKIPRGLKSPLTDDRKSNLKVWNYIERRKEIGEEIFRSFV